MNATPAGADSWRLFLGLWPGVDTRAELVAHADAWWWPAPARRTRVERLHLTLHFLGNVEPEQAALLRQALDVPWPGCTLLLDAPRVWPGGIAVLEASQVPEPLAQLHAQLADRLTQAGVAVEARRYRPHVTFARKAHGANPPVGGRPIAWIANSQYVLVRSLPGGRGYEPVQVFG